MSNVKPEVKFYGLIRDKSGKPKIDGDPKDLHPEIVKLLTNEEKQELGMI